MNYSIVFFHFFNRTLNSADYELLSQLDSVVHNQTRSPIQPDPTCPDYIVASIPTEVVAESKKPVQSVLRSDTNPINDKYYPSS